MSRNGSGVYSLPAGNPVITGTTISSTWANTSLADIASAISGSIAADGQTPITGSLAMGGNKLTNMGTGSVTGNAVEYSQFLAAFVNAIITGDLTVTGNGEFQGTGALKLPAGTTAQEPVGINGMVRYNSDIALFEGYAGGAWGQIGGGATGGGGDQVFVQNSMIVTTSYAIPSGKSAESVGPIQINGGVTVSISSGSRWIVL
jgi:hypothetical protein